MTNKLIKSKSVMPLVLNEAADSTPDSKKYIFSGVFTACSVPGHTIVNRNGRIYTSTEMLKHLGYLREMIKENGCILGELDHPEGRFDVQLKEASHKITDLWYDQNTYNVMGKLELLDTPNGKTAQELVESGYPLFVSSRAAGDVDEKTHEVSIAQIFTYDIVCTPGFQEARLTQVNEKLSSKAVSYLNESVASQQIEKETTHKKYKVLLEGVSVNEVDQEAPLNEKCMEMKNSKINLRKLTKPLLEEDEEFKLPEADITPDQSGDKKKENESEEPKDDAENTKDSENKDGDNDDVKPTEEEKKENRAHILSITGETSTDDSDNADDADKEEKRAHILSIEGQIADENSAEEPISTDEFAEDDETSEETKTQVQKAEELEQKTEEDMQRFQDLLDNLEQKENIKESIIANYPFAISLSEENFNKFATLSPNQKKKCMKFIVEHNIFDIQDINDQFMTPLISEKRMLKNWLRLADKHDIELYTNASLQEQDAIENMARYMILETKQDVDEFWAKTGLREREARRIQNEEFVEQYKIQQKQLMQPIEESEHPLGYKMDYVKMTEHMMENY